MSATTPLPPAPPVPPVPAPASRSPFLYLVTDRWMAISWLVWTCPGTLAVLLLLAIRSTAPSAFVVLTVFLVAGYLFWSLYFGLAACWRLALSMLMGTAPIWIAIIFSMFPPGWIFAILYSWFGGGIYQFARRWWLLAHGRRSPFLTT